MPPVGNKNRIGDIDGFDTGIKKSDSWISPSIEWFNDKRRKLDKYKNLDISYIYPGSFIVNQHTHDLISTAVNDVTELLPIPFNGETWYLLNVFNQVNALDKANSRYKIYRSGKVGWLIKPEFLVDKVPHNQLFKIPENPSRIYFAEHHPDNSENNFKNIVENNNLFGIEFIKTLED